MASKANRRRAPVAVPVKWVAPIKGWRTDIPVADMPPDTASTLINWFPEAAYLRARNGSTAWNLISGGPTADATLIPYEGVTPKLFVITQMSGNTVWDVTAPLPSAPVSAYTGTTTAHVSSTQISTGGGHYLIMCPGSSGPASYNGTAWSAAGFTGPADLTSLNVVTTYRERLYFLQKNSTYLWYGATQAITGALNFLDMGADLKTGGLPVALANWTMETYNGVVQFLVVMTTTGEMLVYQGSNPADSTNWSLLGTFKLSPPLGGDRCMINVGGDIGVMTTDAIVPLSKAISLDPAASDQIALTKAIAPTFLDTVQRVGSASAAWGLAIYPARRMALVNVPDSGLGTYQYVLNTETQAWCQFTNWNALHFKVWNNLLFFVDPNGGVIQAETGSVDQVSQSGGTFVNATIQAVYHGPWQRGDGISWKSPRMMTIDMLVGPNATVYGGVSVDYNPVLPQQIGSSGALTNVARWDIARWDIDVWPGQSPMRVIYNANSPIGIALIPSIQALISGQVGTPSSLYVYGGTVLLEEGGYI